MSHTALAVVFAVAEERRHLAWAHTPRTQMSPETKKPQSPDQTKDQSLFKLSLLPGDGGESRPSRPCCSAHVRDKAFVNGGPATVFPLKHFRQGCITAPLSSQSDSTNIFVVHLQRLKTLVFDVIALKCKWNVQPSVSKRAAVQHRLDSRPFASIILYNL